MIILDTLFRKAPTYGYVLTIREHAYGAKARTNARQKY
jgi:hypothetical protein